MKILLCSLPLLFLAAACQDLGTEARPPVISIHTESTAFELDPVQGMTTVPFVVANRTRATIYLARCGERLMAALDRWQDGRWVQVSGDACQTHLPMVPLPLPSLATTSGERVLDRAGRYRLRPGVNRSAAGNTDYAEVASNEFTVQD